ncbi:MAG: ABC transporter substrate-binding protein [Woeseiaceae bacterium]
MPTSAIRVGLLLFVSIMAGCTSWLPDPEPLEPEPVIVDESPTPVVEPIPEPEPEPIVVAPEPPSPKPIAIVLTSTQPVYSDVAAELAGHFEDHAVYDLSDESLPPVSILRSINDSDSTAVVAIGLRAAESSLATSNAPVVFAQVFNYQHHQLLTDNSRGVAALAPMATQLAAWKQVDPEIRRIGIIVGEGHDGLLDEAQLAAEEHEVELEIRIAHSDQETLYFFRRMIGEIDGFWLLPDNRVLSSRVLKEMFAEGRRHSVTVAVPNESMLDVGATMSISTVPADIAANIAKVLRRIQAGEMKEIPAITELSEVRVNVNDD